MNYESIIAAQKSASVEVVRRLDRLEAYLRDDPGNASLLAEAFETALIARQWDRAQFHMQHALALNPGSLAWSLREADFWLAQGKSDEALNVLHKLESLASPPPGLADAVLHNLALLDFQSNQYVQCIARLQSRMDTDAAPGFSLPLTKLWLRALHQSGELDRAVQWVLHLSPEHRLDPDVSGIASLIALDSQRFDLAGEWSEAALVHVGQSKRPMEALIAQASLALARRDAARARELSLAALQMNPADGRSWSTCAFAELLAGEAALASQHFQTAIQTMPEHIGTWHGLGWSRLIQHQLESARSAFEAALALDRNFSESHGGLAVVLALENNLRGATEHAERALRLDPANLSGRFAQAILRGEISNPQAFEQLAQRLLSDQAAPLGGGSIWSGALQSAMARSVNARAD
ncbi:MULTISPECIES: tetratricopeptide repeat protein [unclassified Acidovorax]|jgi:tetratricopeptide (TPR) repeat protein|uniref:tetratricopeptide repeat protein n=1 Tax=unclassified Acidovorax TaxID=2684926 RepID=UPI000A58F58A|nr:MULTISPECIES: tetratricopeptide repeat protein [unclassified Acidovorax]